MPTDKSWMDQHFGKPDKPVPPPPGSGVAKTIGIVIGLLLILGSACVLAADYFGMYRTGFSRAVGLTPRPTTAESGGEAGATASPAALGSWANLFGSADAADETAHAPTADTAGATESSAGDAELTAAANAARRLQERAASLRRGIDLMQRDLDKIAAEEVFPQFQITIRNSRREPYSAAERVKMANEYLASGRRWTMAELAYINDERTRSQAQVNNAYTRLRELDRKRKSLTARIDQARTDLSALEGVATP